MPNIPLQQSRRWRKPVLAVSAFLIAYWLLPLAAEAQVRECTMPTGSVIYTDRACADLGAVERPHDSATSVSARLYRGGCARSLQDLVYEMTAAVDGGDVNRLAGLYHWPGISQSAATAIMQRLDAIVQWPLIDIAAVAAPGPAGAGDPHDDVYYFQASAQDQPPTGLRLVQTPDNGSASAQTVFGLRRHVGCWWVRF